MTASNAALIIDVLRQADRPMSDSELRAATGICTHQQINQLCHKLANHGVLRRQPGFDGVITNALVAGDVILAPATSSEQQLAEVAMLAVLSARVGASLHPAEIKSPSGARINVDGVSPDRSVLVECWAHQGPAKVAQKWKLVNDAAKLQWAATWLDPTPTRLALCVSDEAAVKHLRGNSWQGQAIKDMGVAVEVVDLSPETMSAVAAAQKRQGESSSYARIESVEQDSEVEL